MSRNSEFCFERLFSLVGNRFKVIRVSLMDEFCYLVNFAFWLGPVLIGLVWFLIVPQGMIQIAQQLGYVFPHSN